jgi:hypothetical protein
VGLKLAWAEMSFSGEAAAQDSLGRSLAQPWEPGPKNGKH